MYQCLCGEVLALSPDYIYPQLQQREIELLLHLKQLDLILTLGCPRTWLPIHVANIVPLHISPVADSLIELSKNIRNMLRPPIAALQCDA